MITRRHIPVFLEETLNLLDAGREGTYVDCTLGLGGHSLEILRRNPKARLIGMDADERSIQEAREILQPYSSRIELYHSDFRYLPELNMNFSRIKGILIDLGISSFQLDSPERGFSHTLNGPLDMRIDDRNRLTAAKIIAKYSESRLGQLLFEYGELHQARKLAREIVSRRKLKPIETTVQLRRLVEEVCRWRAERGKIHPAAKLFLALRIEVNQELKDLDVFLERILEKTAAGTRIAVISFHSLEDRIIKRTFQRLAVSEAGLPRLNILTRKPVSPGEVEVRQNSRARSAKLRAAEKA